MCAEFEVQGAALAECVAEGRAPDAALVEARDYLEGCPLCREVLEETVADLGGNPANLWAPDAFRRVLDALFHLVDGARDALLEFALPEPGLAVATRGTGDRTSEVIVRPGKAIELRLRGGERPGFALVFHRAPAGGPSESGWTLLFPGVSGSAFPTADQMRIEAGQEIRVSFQESEGSVPGRRQLVCLFSEHPLAAAMEHWRGAASSDSEAFGWLGWLSADERKAIRCEVLEYLLPEA